MRGALATFALFLAIVVPPLLACGPYFPNLMLLNGDHELWLAPRARFDQEILRLQLLPASIPSVPPLEGQSLRDQTRQADLADLEEALERANVPSETHAGALRRYAAQRDRILYEKTSAPALRPPPDILRTILPRQPAPDPNWPEEFVDYTRGAHAWHAGEFAAAQSAWENLLNRPADQRHYKSTWAAHMLGRSLEDSRPREAIRYFQSVRALAREGFADRLGLASASLGYEARLHWRSGRHTQAIDLYLEQAATGDPSAMDSLRFCAESALEGGRNVLRPLAKHERAARLITAHLIAGGYRSAPVDVDSPLKEAVVRQLEKQSFLAPPASGWHTTKYPVELWLEAVESAGITNAVDAELFALAAYQDGAWSAAQRWVQLAPSQPVALWIQSKLFLRQGRVHEAAAILSELARRFPSAEPGPDDDARASTAPFPELFHSLAMYRTPWSAVSIPHQIRAELGVLHLARRQYIESLDALLRSGYWGDAAYVAERVLTLDELTGYVDRQWPAPASAAWPDEQAGESIRYLLARRLARAGRNLEARDCFPSRWLPVFDEYLNHLHRAQDPALPPADRGRERFMAAVLLRQHGLELIGTEVEPDWRIHEGQFTEGVDIAARLDSKRHLAAGASAEEIDRALSHGVRPDFRFHYRYLAADLAWEAARLMPDHDDETARMLCVAGGWLKHRDPEAADRFYKALVNRCRRTALGARADQLRWFPPLE